MERVGEERTTNRALMLPTESRTLQLLLLLLRLILGCALVFASVGKIADPSAFATSILHYKVVSGTLALLIATVLPWLELLCGLGLIAGIFLQGSALLAGILMAGFTFLVGSALARGLDISCGCFTQDPIAAKIGWWKIPENLGLTAAALVLFLRRSRWLSAEQYFERRGPSRIGH